MLEVGTCLQNNFSKAICQVIKVDKREWEHKGQHHERLGYKVREFVTGKLAFAWDDEIPYSYQVVDCPLGAVFPPKPTLKIGDCAQWTYQKGFKVLTDQGIIVQIDGDDITLEVQREYMGVKGLAFHDIYELSPCVQKASKPNSKLERWLKYQQ